MPWVFHSGSTERQGGYYFFYPCGSLQDGGKFTKRPGDENCCVIYTTLMYEINRSKVLKNKATWEGILEEPRQSFFSLDNVSLTVDGVQSNWSRSFS